MGWHMMAEPFRSLNNEEEFRRLVERSSTQQSSTLATKAKLIDASKTYPNDFVNPSAKFSLPDIGSQYMAAVESGAAFFLSCLQADGALYSECFAKKKPPFRYFRTVVSGAGDGNRTHVASLEGWSSTIELHPRLALCYYSNAGCGLSTARCAI